MVDEDGAGVELEGAALGQVSSEDTSKALTTLLELPDFKAWEVGKVLSLEGKSWRPHALAPDHKTTLYLSLESRLPRFVIDRLYRASATGVTCVVALTTAALYEEQVVIALAAVDAQVMVLDDYREERRYTQRHVLAALADIEVPVSPEVRKRVGSVTRERLPLGTNHQKGRRLEALLAFLFSQVQDLRVVARNYHGEADEIDIVLQVDNRSNRAWQKPGVPFILVEAKNRLTKADQPDVSTLITKLQTKRGSAKFGFLVAVGGFTTAAALQEMKFASSQEVCVPMIDGDGIGKLIDAADLDEALEEIVRDALLR